MEYLNQVHLRGIVGAYALNREMTGAYWVRFEIMTSYANKIGDHVFIETQWSNVVFQATTKDAIIELAKLQKGSPVELRGRLQTPIFTHPAGSELNEVFIWAHDFHVLPQGTTLVSQTTNETEKANLFG